MTGVDRSGRARRDTGQDDKSNLRPPSAVVRYVPVGRTGTLMILIGLPSGGRRLRAWSGDDDERKKRLGVMLATGLAKAYMGCSLPSSSRQLAKMSRWAAVCLPAAGSHRRPASPYSAHLGHSVAWQPASPVKLPDLPATALRPEGSGFSQHFTVDIHLGSRSARQPGGDSRRPDTQPSWLAEAGARNEPRPAVPSCHGEHNNRLLNEVIT